METMTGPCVAFDFLATQRSPLPGGAAYSSVTLLTRGCYSAGRTASGDEQQNPGALSEDQVCLCSQKRPQRVGVRKGCQGGQRENFMPFPGLLSLIVWSAV